VHELLQVCSALQPLLQPPELSIGFEMLTIAKSNVPPTSLVSAVFFRFFMEDFISLAQLAWKTFQIALVATGAHHQLTREPASLHIDPQQDRRLPAAGAGIFGERLSAI
jgi:hypothetical protein